MKKERNTVSLCTEGVHVRCNKSLLAMSKMKGNYMWFEGLSDVSIYAKKPKYFTVNMKITTLDRIKYFFETGKIWL